MAVVLLVILPLVVFFHSAVLHQALLGNTQWLFVNFYQNEFAGRIATKLMQTSLAVRESVMKLLDVFNDRKNRHCYCLSLINDCVNEQTHST